MGQPEIQSCHIKGEFTLTGGGTGTQFGGGWGRLLQWRGRGNRFPFLFSADMTPVHLLCFQSPHTPAKINQGRPGVATGMEACKQLGLLTIQSTFSRIRFPERFSCTSFYHSLMKFTDVIYSKTLFFIYSFISEFTRWWNQGVRAK